MTANSTCSAHRAVPFNALGTGMNSHDGVDILEDVTGFAEEPVEHTGLVSVLRVNNCCRLTRQKRSALGTPY